MCEENCFAIVRYLLTYGASTNNIINSMEIDSWYGKAPGPGDTYADEDGGNNNI